MAAAVFRRCANIFLDNASAPDVDEVIRIVSRIIASPEADGLEKFYLPGYSPILPQVFLGTFLWVVYYGRNPIGIENIGRVGDEVTPYCPKQRLP